MIIICVTKSFFTNKRIFDKKWSVCAFLYISLYYITLTFIWIVYHFVNVCGFLWLTFYEFVLMASKPWVRRLRCFLSILSYNIYGDKRVHSCNNFLIKHLGFIWFAKYCKNENNLDVIQESVMHQIPSVRFFQWIFNHLLFNLYPDYIFLMK